LREYLADLKTAKQNGRDGGNLSFEIDEELEARIQLTVAPEGFLKRT